MGLTQDQIKELLGTPTQINKSPRNDPNYTNGGYPFRRNTKHLTWVDETLRCTSRRCGCPTNLKVMGAAKCIHHAILQLADILDPPQKLEGEL